MIYLTLRVVVTGDKVIENSRQAQVFRFDLEYGLSYEQVNGLIS